MLADTLGDEARGLVVLDQCGHPQKYDQLEILSQFVAKEVPLSVAAIADACFRFDVLIIN